MALNKCIMMGRLTRDPELRMTGSNIPVVSFSIAVQRDRANADGEKISDFFDVVAWRGTAEFISKYFSKGNNIAVIGPLTTRKWTDKDGNNRISYEIVADNVYFCGDKGSANAKPEPPVPDTNFSEISADDDFPF